MSKLHTEFGTALLKSWNYDHEFQDVTKYHHQPFEAPKITQPLLIIYLANLMRHTLDTEHNADFIANLAKSVAAKNLEITADIIETLLAEVAINMAVAKGVL